MCSLSVADMQSSSAVEELEAGFFDTVGSFFVNYGWATVALVIIVSRGIRL